MIAHRADGALRDAESLFDQIAAFHDGAITAQEAASALGVMPKEFFFTLDVAAKEGKIRMAFDVVEQLFSKGKDLQHFVELYLGHFRTLLAVKLCGSDLNFLGLSPEDIEKYRASGKLYSQEQCLTIMDYLLQAQNEMRFMPSHRLALEALLLRVLRIHQRVPVDFLVRRLSELEQVMKESPENPADVSFKPKLPDLKPSSEVKSREEKIEKEQEIQTFQVESKSQVSMTIDPTPSAEDLGVSHDSLTPNAVKTAIPKSQTEVNQEPSPEKISLRASVNTNESCSEESKKEAMLRQNRYDTLLQFAAIELEGSLQKKQNRGL